MEFVLWLGAFGVKTFSSMVKMSTAYNSEDIFLSDYLLSARALDNGGGQVFVFMLMGWWG